MNTPADGSSPRMQMFEFLGPNPGNPSRTSNHEALITFHEMGHYITNRLVGNGFGLDSQQDGDDFQAGAFPVGGWTDLRPGFEDNYYFSIRRYPYSADTDKNPLTFRHISTASPCPAGRRSIPTPPGPTARSTTPGRSGARRCGRCSSTWSSATATPRPSGGCCCTSSAD
jgi:extracellular elastinolytic metalloproteinase